MDAHALAGDHSQALSVEIALEGQFNSSGLRWQNTRSGFFCKRCRNVLLVGDHSCPWCEFRLGLTTPPLAYVKSLPAARQWTFYTDRIDGDELRRIQRSQSPTRPSLLRWLLTLFHLDR